MNCTYQMRSAFACTGCHRLALDVPVASKLFDPPVIKRCNVPGDNVAISEFSFCFRGIREIPLCKKLPAFWARGLLQGFGRQFGRDRLRVLVPVERRLVISNDPRRQQPPATWVEIKPIEYGTAKVFSSRRITHLINTVKQDKRSSLFKYLLQVTFMERLAHRMVQESIE